MATIINTPAAVPVREESSSGSMNSLIIGLLLLLILVAFFFYVGLPMMRNVSNNTQAPQINVPDKINVEVNTPQAQ